MNYRFQSPQYSNYVRIWLLNLYLQVCLFITLQAPCPSGLTEGRREGPHPRSSWDWAQVKGSQQLPPFLSGGGGMPDSQESSKQGRSGPLAQGLWCFPIAHHVHVPFALPGPSWARGTGLRETLEVIPHAVPAGTGFMPPLSDSSNPRGEFWYSP